MNAPIRDEAREAAIETARRSANQELDPLQKAKLGQFMTPASVARFMAGLFSERSTEEIRLLDAGAGVGSLTAAFLGRFGGRGVAATAYEVDRHLAAYLRRTLASEPAPSLGASIFERDFIHDAVFHRVGQDRNKAGFTHAILNPPYKKIDGGSEHRALLRAVGLETVNLYTAFVGLAVELMADGGEVVAIIPRSFCNGVYYKPFRDWILSRTALDHIHLFHSRTSAFDHDDVLQENVIIKLVRGKRQGEVTISTSSDASFGDLARHAYKFAEIVHDGDEQRFIHVPTSPEHTGIESVPLATRSLSEIGLSVSTGPVVDFRLRRYLLQEPEAGTVPLLYPTHFVDGEMEWPRLSKKPNAMLSTPETAKWCYPNGFYTVVRRFSSKEERRRVVAHVVDPSMFGTSAIAFENHLNVFHAGRAGLDPDVAHGLSAFLNSTAVDEYFRRFSGHTQVNATDLKLLRYPDSNELAVLGQWMRLQRRPSQESIDRRVLEQHGR